MGCVSSLFVKSPLTTGDLTSVPLRQKRTSGEHGSFDEFDGVLAVPWSCTVFGDGFTGSCLRNHTRRLLCHLSAIEGVLSNSSSRHSNHSIHSISMYIYAYLYFQAKHLEIQISHAAQVPAQSKRPSVDPRRDGALASVLLKARGSVADLEEPVARDMMI